MTDLPEGWSEVTLGDVCEYVRGVTYEKSDATYEPAHGFLPLLRATNIEDRRIVLKDFVFVPASKVKPAQMLRKGDLLIAASSGSIQVVGKSAPISEGFVGTFGAFCAVLRPTTSNQKFLEYFVSSPGVRGAWSAAARGTNINNLKRESVLRTAMPLPPLPEQERIVDILDEQFFRLDSALASIRVVREKAQAFRRSLLHAAFTGNLSGGKDDWRDVALGDHIETIMGQAPLGTDCNKTGNGVVFVKVGEFGAIVPEVREWTVNPLKMAHVGDVLLCVVGATVGKVNLAIDCAIGRSVAALRPLDSLTTKYLYYFISMQGEFIRQGSRGSAQGVVSKKDISGFVLPLPPLRTQERIVGILDEQFSRLDEVLQVSNLLEKRVTSERLSLLHAAFTGQLSANWRDTYV